MSTHYHFIIWASMDKVGDQFQSITYIDIIANTIDEAVIKAKKICPNRRHYWVNNIVEHHDKEE